MSAKLNSAPAFVFVHQPGLQGEELFRENEQGQIILAVGIA
ncbi:hypothetical protein [Arthrobacter sp. MA-N2]|nr:hypothetical protein [Arthrobacter sp. MA-N2]